MTITTNQSPTETFTQRIIIPNVSWQTYKTLLAEAGDNRGTRFAYNQGVLEIIMPSDLHENINCLLKQFVTTLADELNLKRKGFGSTTLNREDLNRGAEPDSCFYIQNVERIRGRKINLETDPAPDLVIEIDITSPSKDRLPIYQQLEVGEIWRYRRNGIQILRLENGEYVNCDRSSTFPIIAVDDINRFLQMADTEDDTTIIQALRHWIRQQLQNS